MNDRNNPYKATPFAWAKHEGRHEVSDWMSANCALDLHDAVYFDVRQGAEARIVEDPSCVNRVVDHWQLPRATPLHHAARLNRLQLAPLLLASGADPNLLAGDGRTALDIAEDKDHAELAQLLRNHGALRAEQL